MGKIVSTVTDAIGLTNTKADKAAASAAAASSEAATALAQANLEFQKEQYADWKAVYGDITDNLGEYYKNLGPEKITALGLTAQQQEYQIALQEIKRTNAARGLSGSAFEKASLDNAAMANATARATIRATAEDQTIKEKMNFLGLGLGQGESMLGNINNAANIGVGANTNAANMFMGRANNTANNNAAMMRSLVNEGGSLIGLKLK